MTDPNSGEGWYEWHKMPANTTEIAHVGESGEVYDPVNGWNPVEFALASAESRVRRLVRADDEDALLEALSDLNDGRDTEPSESCICPAKLRACACGYVETPQPTVQDHTNGSQA